MKYIERIPNSILFIIKFATIIINKITKNNMQSLKDYLNESTQQYESVFGGNQTKDNGYSDDNTIRTRILQYCTFDWSNKCWPIAAAAMKITKVDKDEKGWYIDTVNNEYPTGTLQQTEAKTVLGYCNASKYRIKMKSFFDKYTPIRFKDDDSKEFVVVDREEPVVHFRWRKHKGGLTVLAAPNFESTEGLPDELDTLYVSGSCQSSKGFDVRNKIDTIVVEDTAWSLKISGNGCKDLIIDPDSVTGEITAPSRTKIHRPENCDEYISLKEKLV